MDQEQPKPATTPTEETVEQVPVIQSENDNGQSIAPHGKREGISFGIVVAASVLIALALITVGYFAYRGTAPQEQNANDATQSAAETEVNDTLDRSSPVDEGAVDTELEQIEAEVDDLNNSSDFNEEELTEEELGL